MSDTFTSTKELEIVEAVVSQLVPRHELHRQCGGFKTFVHVSLPANIDGMLIRLQELYAADSIKTSSAQWPADWWEAVKERFAPQWFLERYPVRYASHTVELKAIWQGYKPEVAKAYPIMPYVRVRYDRGDQCF